MGMGSQILVVVELGDGGFMRSGLGTFFHSTGTLRDKRYNKCNNKIYILIFYLPGAIFSLHLRSKHIIDYHLITQLNPGIVVP